MKTSVLCCVFLFLCCFFEVHATASLSYTHIESISTSDAQPSFIKDSKLVSIQNSIVRISVDLAKGCSLVEFTDLSTDVNTINSYDLGRQVQASFYGGPTPYDDCVWNNQPWPWNPIGSGDSDGNPSTVLGVDSGEDYIACTIRPKQWACKNVDCECTFDLRYTIENNIAHGAVQLNNNRADTTDYGPFLQEIPAVYLNGFLYRLLGYDGNNPWTFDQLTEWNASFDGTAWSPGTLYGLTENFLMFTNTDGSFGVGVYNRKEDIVGFNGGFAGEKGTGGPSNSSTGYIAPVSSSDLPGVGKYNYEYALIMGNIDTIRKTVYSLHDRA